MTLPDPSEADVAPSLKQGKTPSGSQNAIISAISLGPQSHRSAMGQGARSRDRLPASEVETGHVVPVHGRGWGTSTCGQGLGNDTWGLYALPTSTTSTTTNRRGQKVISSLRTGIVKTVTAPPGFYRCNSLLGNTQGAQMTNPWGVNVQPQGLGPMEHARCTDVSHTHTLHWATPSPAPPSKHRTLRLSQWGLCTPEVSSVLPEAWGPTFLIWAREQPRFLLFSQETASLGLERA